jgi:hypothetical protein
MVGNQSLLNELQELLSWKRSKKFYASKLGISIDELNGLMSELRNRSSVKEEAEIASYIGELEECVYKMYENVETGTGEIVFNSKEEIKTLEELIEKCKIDTSKWQITKYVQNYWGNSDKPYYQVKAWLSRKDEKQLFQDSFLSFLETYQPSSRIIQCPDYQQDKNDGCLIINKQDAHLDKLDIEGENDIDERFETYKNRVAIIVDQATISNQITDIVYVIGSDEFNSEFTGATTKGTPQQNIVSYHESFKSICNHEIEMINFLLKKGDKVEVVFVAGNHDEFVGWHLTNWLKAYYRNEPRVSFDISPRYRKYISYGDSAIMFNHGDALKPAKLAHLFPMEYKEKWSNHNNFYIFTGDKHHEMSLDFNGIKFYQLPSFSKAKSSWDDKNGYTTGGGEIMGFLIDYSEGMTNIFKQYI